MPGDRKHHSDKMRSCVEKVMADGHEESSAYAICTASLQKAGEPIFEAAAAGSPEELRLLAEEGGETGLRHLHLRGALGRTRTELWEGREHLVIPVVALQEGVIHAVNAPDPEFVPEQVLVRSHTQWNGHPIVVGHPVKNGRQCSAHDTEVRGKHDFGLIRLAYMHNKRLGMEVLADPARLEALGQQQLLTDLRNGVPVEVSVGVYARTNGKTGDFNGKKYKAEWTELVPDHLAFLPNGRGACSLEMGCGAHRAAIHLVTAAAIVEETEVVGPVFSFFRSLMPRGWGDDEVKQDLRDALSLLEPTLRHGGEVLRVTNNTIVYCLYPPPVAPDYATLYPGYPSAPTYWRRDYAYDTATKRFNVSAERVQVEPTTVYEVLKSLVGKPTYKDCPVCEGSGNTGGNPCEACDGSGEIRVAAAPISASAAKKGSLRVARIRHEGGKWVLYSQDGSKKLGQHDTKAEAEAQERAIDEKIARKAS